MQGDGPEGETTRTQILHKEWFKWLPLLHVLG